MSATVDLLKFTHRHLLKKVDDWLSNKSNDEPTESEFIQYKQIQDRIRNEELFITIT